MVKEQLISFEEKIGNSFNNGEMTLTQIMPDYNLEDIKNSIFLKDVLNERNQASVVSRAILIVCQLIKLLREKPGNRLIVLSEDGEKREIIIPGIS